MPMEPPVVETLDIRGQVCPSSLLISLRRVNAGNEAIRAGRMLLVILTDNRDSVGTVSDAVEDMGLRVTARKDGDHYVLTVSAAGGEGK